MLQWVTFGMALFSTVLWVCVLVAGFGIYRQNRQQVAAVRAMSKAMGAMSGPLDGPG